MANSKTGGVPAETATEEWRIMSAEIAYELWRNPAREEQRAESHRRTADWELHAPKHRARIRYVLRALVAEGIRMERGAPADANDRLDQGWWKASARFAWLLWLRGRRDEHVADHASEELFWEIDSQAYRNYLRSALRNLRAQGLHLKY